MRNIAVSMATAALLGGCGDPQPGELVRSWSANFAEYNINVVFPPRESFQVGDILLSYTAADVSAGPLPQSVHVDRLDLLREWDDYQARQLDVASAGAYAANAVFVQPEDGARRLGNSARPGTRLSLAAFPQLEVARVSAASLGLGATGSPVLAALGFTASDEISVKVLRTEQMALPQARIEARFGGWLKQARTTDTVEWAALCNAYATMGARLEAIGVRDPSLLLIMPTEVYYTRGLNYSTLESSAMTAQASAILDASTELSALVEALGEPPDGEDGADGGGDADRTAATLSRSQLEDLQFGVADLQRAVGGFGAGGGALSVATSSAFGVSINEDFSRPLAFGYRGPGYDAASLVAPDCPQFNARGGAPGPANEGASTASQAPGAGGSAHVQPPANQAADDDGGAPPQTTPVAGGGGVGVGPASVALPRTTIAPARF